MKTLKKVLITLTTALAICSFSMVGCTTSKDPITLTNHVVGSTTITVDGAMQGWGAYVRAGKASVSERIKVRDAYIKYQRTMQVAEDVAVVSLSATNGIPAYRIALDSATAASADLILLINTIINQH